MKVGAGKPVHLKAQLSYARDEQVARQQAHQQWRNNVFASDTLSDLRTPKQFDGAGKFVSEDEIEPVIHISSEPQRHVSWIQEDIAFGFDQIFLHNVNTEQRDFIDDFGAKVLPELGLQ